VSAFGNDSPKNRHQHIDVIEHYKRILKTRINVLLYGVVSLCLSYSRGPQPLRAARARVVSQGI
jgi:hypothetical protein